MSKKGEGSDWDWIGVDWGEELGSQNFQIFCRVNKWMIPNITRKPLVQNSFMSETGCSTPLVNDGI